jgi:hypothetical protein
LPPLSDSANNWERDCCHCHRCLSPPTTGGPISAVVRLCQQLGELLLTMPLLSDSTNNCWSRCRQLGETSPLLSVSVNDSTNNWGSCYRQLGSHHCRHPTLPTTGGAVVTLAVAVHANTHLGLPPFIPADTWGTRCRCCSSLPTSEGGIVAVAAIVRLH